MPDIDLTTASTEAGSIEPEQGRALAERLRLAAGFLHEEFEGLSMPEAERLVFQAAQEVLSAASVIQFVPTFAERRARRMLSGGLPLDTAAEASFELAGPSWDLAFEADSESGDPTGTAPVPAPAACAPADPASAPRWSGESYATEARRLLERARQLRTTSLAPETKN